MNDSDDPLNDEVLGELLAPLRTVAVPDSVQGANRLAIAQVFARHSRPVWWRRSVAVPVPLAIAATVAIVAGTVALLAPAVGQKHVDVQVLQVDADRVVSMQSEGDPKSENASPAPWRITRSYIQSLSSLRTGRDVVDFDAKDDSDDS